MTLSDLFSRPELLLLDADAGSHAYGLQLPESDHDRRGVFLQPRENFYGFAPLEQVADDKNDQVYWEIGKFLKLLAVNNPSALELLATEGESLRVKHPLLAALPVESLLSRLCEDSFLGYAEAQVKRARGLNKRVNLPENFRRRTLLDFAFVAEDGKSMPLRSWLAGRGWRQEDCGLIALDHMPGLFALYHGPGLPGLVSSEDATDILLASLAKDARADALICVNRNAFSTHCKEHREWLQWREERNEARYRATAEQGRGYDAKNMMHTFRLLAMAREIARDGVVRVRRPDRDELLAIRGGRFSYEELLLRAECEIAEIRDAFARSDLPPAPDREALEELLCEIREQGYRSQISIGTIEPD